MAATLIFECKVEAVLVFLLVLALAAFPTAINAIEPPIFLIKFLRLLLMIFGFKCLLTLYHKSINKSLNFKQIYSPFHKWHYTILRQVFETEAYERLVKE